MNYINSFQLFLENESNDSIRVTPYFFLNDMVTDPKRINNTMDPKLVENMLGWKDIYRSPTSLSFYNMPKNWNFTPDGVLRVSDHWNFYIDRYFDKRRNRWVERDILHCRTDKEVPDKTHWTVAKYDRNSSTYNVIATYPKSDFRSELVKLRNKVFRENKEDKQEIKKKSYNKLVQWVNLGWLEIKVDGTYYKIAYFNERNNILKFKENLPQKSIDMTAKDLFDGKSKLRLYVSGKYQYLTWSQLIETTVREVSS